MQYIYQANVWQLYDTENGTGCQRHYSARAVVTLSVTAQWLNGKDAQSTSNSGKDVGGGPF